MFHKHPVITVALYSLCFVAYCSSKRVYRRGPLHFNGARICSLRQHAAETKGEREAETGTLPYDPSTRITWSQAYLCTQYMLRVYSICGLNNADSTR